MNSPSPAPPAGKQSRLSHPNIFLPVFALLFHSASFARPDTASRATCPAIPTDKVSQQNDTGPQRSRDRRGVGVEGLGECDVYGMREGVVMEDVMISDRR